MKKIFLTTIVLFLILDLTSAKPEWNIENSIGYSSINDEFDGLATQLTYKYQIYKFLSCGLNCNLSYNIKRVNDIMYDESFSTFFLGPSLSLHYTIFDKIVLQLNGSYGKARINDTFEKMKISSTDKPAGLSSYSQAVSGEYWGNTIMYGSSLYYKTTICDLGINYSMFSCSRFQKYRNSQVLFSIKKSF